MSAAPGAAARPAPLGRGFVLAVALGTAVVVAAVAARYAAAERTFEAWDEAAYQDAAVEMAATLAAVRTPTDALAVADAVLRSTGADYSLFHTLLPAPVLLALGATRPTYVVTLALVHLVPLALLVGALATLFAGAHRRRAAFVAGVAATLLLPPAWLPSLRGYPDTGGAVLATLAALLYLRTPERPRVGRALTMGALLALAVLFRRHLAYAAIAILLAIAADLAGAVLARPAGAARRDAWQGGARGLAWIAAGAAATLGLLGWRFVRHVARTDVGALYASWQQPPGVAIAWYVESFGLAAVAIAGAGLAAGALVGTVARRPAAFALVAVAVAAVQWTLLVRQLGVHYTVHFTPWIALGLVAAWLAVAGRVPRARTAAAIAGTAAGVVGLGATLAPWPGLAPLPTAVRLLLPLPAPPMRRADHDELVRLIATLRGIDAGGGTIVVAASSRVLSDDLIWHADRALGARDGSPPLPLVRWAPFADSKHGYPLEALMSAGVVVTATPLQLHLQSEEQDVLRVADAALAPGAAFAADFATLPQRFRLDGGVEVALHRRLRPTRLATALATLDAMTAAVGSRPGGQASWIGLGDAPGCVVRQRSRGRVRLRCDPATAGTRRTFLHLDPAPGAARVRGRLEPAGGACPPVAFALAAVAADGTRLATAADARPPGAIALVLPAVPPRARLLLEVDAGTCRVVLEEVVVEDAAADP